MTDMNYLCRICETTDQMKMVFNSGNNDLFFKLNLIIPFQITIGNSVPLCICIECCHKLELVYHFKLQYLNTCAKFRSVFNAYQKQNNSLVSNIKEQASDENGTKICGNSEFENSPNSYIVHRTEKEITTINSALNVAVKAEFPSPDDFQSQTCFRNSQQTAENLYIEPVNESVTEVTSDRRTCIPPNPDNLQSAKITSAAHPSALQTALCDSVTNQFPSLNPIVTNDMASKTEENNLTETCYTCEYCGKSFRKRRSLRSHRLKHLGPRNFKCDHCGKLFRTLERVKNHQIWDSCADPFKCKECGGVFIDFATLWRHFIWHRNNETGNSDDNILLVPLSESPINDGKVKSNLYKCDFCGKTYTVGTNLRKHQRMHLNMRPFKCEHCDRSFMTPSALNSHKVLHVNPELFKCDECGKSFTRAVALRNHQALHANPNLFQCDECGKTCTTNFYLKKHMMIHSEIRPFKCEECGKVFKESYTLRQHQALHANPNLFHCNECGKSFRRSSVFKVHLELHLNPNKFRCSECGRTFTRSQALRNHIALHRNPNLFACECGKAFRSIESLRYHKLSHLKEKNQNENEVQPLNSTLTIVDPTQNSV